MTPARKSQSRRPHSTLHEKLTALASNLWWSWQPEVTNIFREIDPTRWTDLNHNPVKLLQEYPPELLEERATELALHARVNLAYRRWREYIEADDTWSDTHSGVLRTRPVAYFSAEFGLHESLPIYSGGLGVLAGDHLKSASDLGVPLVGVGLFYSEGYFSQRVGPDGWQHEDYTQIERAQLPIRAAVDANGRPVRVTVETRHGAVHAQVWELHVGRVRLFLLDTFIPENSDEDRQLTARLYGGDQRTRIRQEIILGIGGARALRALGINPGVIHLNEGHSAFAALEFIRIKMEEEGLSFEEAMHEVARRGVFTTHTPVPAGHDRFTEDMIEEHVGPLADQLGLDRKALMGLGRVDPQNPEETFCMTVLAFKLTRHANGVSNLHGVVSRRMWRSLWPWLSEDEVPIGHITNGVHVPTWLAGQMRVLYDRVLPPRWYLRSGEPEVWAGFEDVPPIELWEVHQSLKYRLIVYARRRLLRQLKRGNPTDAEIRAASEALDPEKLLIGFARRFAPYKRADLILADLDVLDSLVNHPQHPIQFIFAGKAHPADEPGKRILQRVYQITQDPRFKGKVVFLEDYDINLARHLVQGVDVWLNNPRRPMEASGTSGEKVILNGGLNLSVLDGWWAEAYDGLNGFAFGGGRRHRDEAVQDRRDAEDLLRVLREEVIPAYYHRDQDDLPQQWIRRMKRAVRTLGWRFNADRMVMDYVQHAYLPAAGAGSCHVPQRP